MRPTTSPRAILRWTAATVLAAAVVLASAPAALAAPVPGAAVASDAIRERTIAGVEKRAVEAEERRAEEQAAKEKAAKEKAAKEKAAKEKAAKEKALRCDELTDPDIPTLVAEVFRCRLAESGLFGEGVIDRVVAEAIVVAHCESRFDPNVVVFGGRYLHQRHPWTGYYYSAAGVFQFIRKTADQWIVGGYDNVFDPTANIDAAARLYVSNRRNGYRGWDDWACAAANDGFKATSVLPGWPGGPEALPEWARKY